MGGWHQHVESLDMSDHCIELQRAERPRFAGYERQFGGEPIRVDASDYGSGW